MGKKFQITASGIADKIDRNLFERYGDVQAFTLNGTIQERDQWYEEGREKNAIAGAMNQYVGTYGIYYLTIFVDLQGTVVAVNDKDASGNSINTAFLYGKNFSKAPWFKALQTDQFTTKMPFTAAGNDVSSGTFIEDLHIDSDVKASYPGDDGLTISFSAPVYQDGKKIGYWTNRTKFSLVEEVFASSYQALKADGYPGAELTLLDSMGRIIVDYDPVKHGKEEVVHDLDNVLMKVNLAEKGVATAQQAVAGKTGYMNALHARKKIVQAGGYAHLKGALGYPGMNWSVLVRIPQVEAAAAKDAMMQKVWLTALVTIALILPIGWYVGQSGAGKVKTIQDVAQKMAAGDYDARVQSKSNDEIGQLGQSFNDMAEAVQRNTTEMARTSSLVENAPVNIMYADRDFKIQYMNPASTKTLKTIEQYLPIKVEQMIGHSIDVFHKNPEHQRRIVSDPKNLPHRAQINVGPEILDLLVSPIYDNNQNYLGPMVTWEVITQKLKAETEMARVMSMMENAPINVIFADLDFRMQYVNPASVKTLEGLEQYLPCKIKDLVGQSIDIMHKNPDHQRRILKDPKNLPHRAQIQLGPETLDLLVSAIYDNNNKYMGPMVTWEVITAKLEQERQIKEAGEREKAQGAKLQEGVSQIADIAGSLATAAEELTSVSNQMGSTAEETSSQANVVSAAAEEVSKNVQSVATGSEEMGASIKEIAKNTTDAAKVASQAVTAAETTNATVAKLGQSSAEIGSIIKVITSIAEQTNLLALNATIEAARAGEAGKGFAVVANEVKELAKETTKATENIGNMIETIQEDTKGAVDAIGQISTIIKQVNDFQNTIASSVEEQTVTTNEMTRNVSEASRGSTEIASNIVNVAQAAKGTTEGATQTQTSASELAQMASNLQKVVSELNNS